MSPLQEVDNGGQDSRPLGRCCVNSAQSWAQKIIFEQIVNERRRIVRRECGQKPYYVESAEQLLVFSAIYCREHLFISYWTWGQASSPRIQTTNTSPVGGGGHNCLNGLFLCDPTQMLSAGISWSQTENHDVLYS